jgi:hypothetical protein
MGFAQAHAPSRARERPAAADAILREYGGVVSNRVNQVNNQIDFERELVPGAVVLACWTSCYRYYSAKAEVVRVNSASVRIRLVECLTGQGYSPGREFSLPRFYADRWSVNNGVFAFNAQEWIARLAKKRA